MSPVMLTVALPVMTTVITALLVGAVILLLMRRRRALAQAVPTPTPEGLKIPVNAIYAHAEGLLGAAQHNSLHPELTIGRSGISFRAMTRKHWPIAEIAHVEARLRRGGWKLVFVGRGHGVVVADVIGETNVLAALRALPDGVAMTPQAALLRNGSAAAGREDLRLYRGRMR